MPSYSDTAAANTVVTRSFAALPNIVHRLTSIVVSWSGAAATTGLLTVTDGGAVVFSADIPLALNTPFVYDRSPIVGSLAAALVVTVSAGGAGAIAKLNTTIDDKVYPV